MMFKKISDLEWKKNINYDIIKFLKRFLFLNCVFVIHLFLSISTTDAADIPLDQITGLPPGGITNYVRNIRDQYIELKRYQYRFLHNGMQPDNGNLRQYFELINDFEASLFQTRPPFQPPNNAESERLSIVLRSAYININNFINQYPANSLLRRSNRSLFKDVLEKLEHRHNLGKIESSIQNGEGWMGQNVLVNIPDGNAATPNIFRDTIEHLTGRIFVVDPQQNNPVIISTSSAMIIPRQHSGSVVYDQIITCGHSMKPDNTNPDLEFYFIRSNALNPATGLPHPLDISNVLALGHPNAAQADNNVSTLNFIQYLRAESINLNTHAVRRIVSFQAFSPAHPVHTLSILADHSPRYRPSQDNGYGHLNAAFNLPAAVQIANVQVLNALPNRNPSYRYYALGYPGFSYFALDRQSRLVRERRFAPFTMTSSLSAATMRDNQNRLFNVLRVSNNHKLNHGAYTMKGMSGGPLLRFIQNTNNIEILGVVQSGTIEGNFSAKFW